MNKPNIVICGNYGATNVGDEAILMGALNLVSRAYPGAKVTVLSAAPAETAAAYGVESAAFVPAGVRSFFKSIFRGSLWRTIKVLRRADLMILGGGGLFTDEKVHAVMIWGLQAFMARILGTPVACLGQSVGPLRTKFGRWAARHVFKKAVAVGVRDRSSFELLREMGISNVDELSDLAFSSGISGKTDAKREDYVVLTARPWLDERNFKVLAQFIDWLWKEKNLRTVLVPFQLRPDNDVEVLERIRAQVFDAQSAEIFEFTTDHKKVMEVLSRATVIVGMRLHSLILSSLAVTPFIGLSYSEKVVAFGRSMEMENYILDWKDLKLEDLQERFDNLLKESEQTSILLQKKADEMRDLNEKYVGLMSLKK